MTSWRDRCRECDAPTVRNRAWCRRHLDAMQRGDATEFLDGIIDEESSHRIPPTTAFTPWFIGWFPRRKRK